MTVDDLIRALPKAELHIHIEGTLEPELMFELAEKNRVELPWKDIDAVRDAYRFTDLSSFLEVYYRGAAVLRTEEDFARLMGDYLRRARSDGVRHAEIFFDPQTHTERGIGFPVFMEGFRQAMADAEGITSSLILCFLRHLSPDSAMQTLEAAEPHLEGVIGVGLDSAEVGNPPELFADAYRRARALGLRAVAHAGEEGPADYIWGALRSLEVERVDHGVRALDDSSLMHHLREREIPVTMCPLSNVRLRVIDRIGEHPIRQMFDFGLLVSVNSDDPAYFGGYVGDNYRALAGERGFTPEELVQLARNSVESTFLPSSRKRELLAEIDALASS